MATAAALLGYIPMTYMYITVSCDSSIYHANCDIATIDIFSVGLEIFGVHFLAFN